VELSTVIAFLWLLGSWIDEHRFIIDLVHFQPVVKN